MKLQRRMGAGDLTPLEVESTPLIMRAGVPAPEPARWEPAHLPAYEWQEAWRLELPGTQALGARGGRALAAGPRWALIDLERGEVVSRGAQPEAGVMALDPTADLFYAAPGRLSVASTIDGAYASGADLSGRGPAQTIARHEGLLWVVTADAEQATMDLLDIDVTAATATPRGALRCQLSGAPLVASCGGWVFLAAGEHLLWCDPELSPLSCTLPEGAQVLGLSLDEAGRAHAVVAHEGQNQLWVLAPPGERLLRLRPLPAKPFLPCAPLLAPDRSFSLLAEGHIDTAGYEGHRWSARTRGHVIGAALLREGLLTCERDRLVTYDLHGARRQLHHFGGQALTGGPVVTEQGLVLVSTAEAVVALEPQAH